MKYTIPSRLAFSASAALAILLITTPGFAQRTSDPCTGTMCGGGGEFACVANNCVDDGKLMITLSWTVNTDLDISLQTPDGNVISASLDGSIAADGGELRRDECYRESTCEGDASHPNIEHIVWDWDEALPQGDYTVWATNFNGAQGSSFDITVTKYDGSKETFSGSVPATEEAKSGEFTFTIDGDTVCDEDTDRDGLCDKWEREGVDIDEDGTIDLDLPKLGADPQHKDLFVEIDRLNGQMVYGLGGVVSAFADAPVDNPDGKNGITLHWHRSDEITDIDGTAIGTTHDLQTSNFGKVKFGTNSFTDETTSCSKGWFGDQKDRDDANCENIIKAKRKVYRYAVYSHSYDSNGSSGRGELPGDDFIIAMGQAGKLNDQANQAGTFMHELGHTLNLHHGGDDDIIGKPNHQSIMNYYYQFSTPYVGRPLDYSREKLPDFDQGSADEGDGIQGSSNAWKHVVFYHASPPATLPTGYTKSSIWPYILSPNDGAQAQDWNLDSDTKDTSTRQLSVNGGTGVLSGHLDWDAILLNFQDTGATNGSFGQGFPDDEEAPADELEEAAADLDYDEDGVNDRDDNCPGLANEGQEDEDEDEVGDACDACPTLPAPGYTNGCPEDVDPQVDIDQEGGGDSADGDEDRSVDGDGDGGDDSTGGGDDDERPELIKYDKGCSTTGGVADLSWMALFAFGIGFARRRRRRREV